MLKIFIKKEKRITYDRLRILKVIIDLKKLDMKQIYTICNIKKLEDLTMQQAINLEKLLSRIEVDKNAKSF